MRKEQTTFSGSHADACDCRTEGSRDQLERLRDWLKAIRDAGVADRLTGTLEAMVAQEKICCEVVTVEGLSIAVYGCSDPSAEQLLKNELERNDATVAMLTNAVSGRIRFVRVLIDSAPQLMFWVCVGGIAASLTASLQGLRDTAVRLSGDGS